MMTLPELAAIEAAADLIHPVVPPTPQILWPLLSQRAGAEVWVKHENHTLIGAFKRSACRRKEHRRSRGDKREGSSWSHFRA
jgi:threonine dehydratase